MGVTFSQFFPPSPALTEANLPSQAGRVFLVTGGTSGIGLELCRILFHAGGKVYLAGRSEAAANKAINSIKADSNTTTGEIRFLPLHLDDLSTIKPAVEKFTASESRLDVLFNNAGVSLPPLNSVSAQGHELQMATNCLGPYLLTQLLLPTLIQTAKTSASAAVRVVWVSSVAVDVGAPKNGIDMANMVSKNQQENYAISKTGNWYLASELASQVSSNGILSITVNPGNLKTDLTRHMPKVVALIVSPLLYKAKFGAYSELWAAFSSELSIKHGGSYIVPWGRLHPQPRPDLVAALASKSDGGSGVAGDFAAWCGSQTATYR